MSMGQWFTPPASFVPGMLHQADVPDCDPYLNSTLTIDGQSGTILSFADSSAGRVYDFYYDNCEEPKKIPEDWFLLLGSNPIRKKGRGGGA